MGREVRRVPPNWKHPKQAGWSDGRLQPMYNRTYQSARDAWLKGLAEHKPEETDPPGLDYWEWDGSPPDRAYYRPWKDEEATWFQVWETVSEGTPVTPPFETREELAQYLAKRGDEWDQHRGNSGWGIERARAFVGQGWVPSLVITGDGRVLESKDIALELGKKENR